MPDRVEVEWAEIERLAAQIAASTEKESTSRVMAALAVLLQQHLGRAIKSSPLEPHERFNQLYLSLGVAAGDIASRSVRTRP